MLSRMNKKKRIALWLSIFIPFILIILGISIYFIILSSYRNLPPLNNKTYSYNSIELRTSDNKVDRFDKAKLVIKKITKDEYNNSSLINVFYDYAYDVYYKVDITLEKDNKVYNAKTFCVHSRNIKQFYRQRYSFDIEIDGQVYENALFIYNYGLTKPVIRLGSWGIYYE